MSSSGRYQSISTPGVSGSIQLSDDYGSTWTTSSLTGDLQSIGVSESGKFQISCKFADTLYLSSDFGATWSPTGVYGNWLSVVISVSGKNMSAVGGYNNIVGGFVPVYVSSDFGSTWTYYGPSVNWIAIAMNASGSIQTAFVSNGQIYLSSNYGVTWSSAIGSTRFWLYADMSASGQYQIACFNAGGVSISIDFGLTWTEPLVNAGLTWRAVAISASGQYQGVVVEQGFFYVSSNYGSTWISITNNITIPYGISMSASGQYVTIAGKTNQLYTYSARIISAATPLLSSTNNSSSLSLSTSDPEVTISTVTTEYTFTGKKIRIDYSVDIDLITTANWAVVYEIRLYRGVILISTTTVNKTESSAGTQTMTSAKTYTDTATSNGTLTYDLRIIFTSATNITSSSCSNRNISTILFN